MVEGKETTSTSGGGGATDNNSKDKKPSSSAPQQASFSETLGFVFQCGPRLTCIFFIGFFGGFLNGLVYPTLAYLFSTSFSDLSSAAVSLDPIRDIAMIFLAVGTYALVVGTIQTWAFEIVSYEATQNLRLQWFTAMLRQDAAYFDVHEVGGIAAQVGPASNKYRRGLGRKFGEGIQFLTTGIGGLGFAFYSSWQVALVVLGVVPFVGMSAMMVMTLNQTKGSRAAAAYKTAGSVAYASVSAIKTVLSLNAVPKMIQQYTDATLEAYQQGIAVLVKQGFYNGAMLGSFMMLYCVLTLFGTFLLYNSVGDNGCDPSDSVDGNEACKSTGAGVFGAMLGVAFAAQGVSQFGSFSEAFTAARVAAYEALKVIHRMPGAPEEIVYRSPDDDDLGTTTHSKKSKDESGGGAITTHSKKSKDNETTVPVVKAILPKYEIDSTATSGLKPNEIRGAIKFNNVVFSYPTRPHETVLKGMTTEIEPGQTVAFVGPSGSGKSTVVAMLERFYDPKSGSVELDGVNLKDLNVAHLRSSIGYVGQEPTLFATSIRANIQYGNPDATFEQIQEAARLANAHDFIMSFTDGYDTQVGDKGSQLSGGQKQRIAIARVLVSAPKILLLDEATSALDSESELVVQDALDNILEQQKITTIIIAHRLSTIRGCDIINVLVDGMIAESGSHSDLMDMNGYYRSLVEKQDGTGESGSNSGISSRNESEADLHKLGEDETAKATDGATTTNGMTKMSSMVPHLAFKDVTFAYPTRPHKIVFNGFNLNIERGSTVALVGPSGGGKSTTVGLVERFYDPLSGTVEYDGVDIKALNLHWYRDQIGYVGQEPTLFNDTIANNIAYGAPGASRAEIVEAAKQANAHDFIMEFADNYDTPVGERGTQLSGGQKQRVAIARALVKKPHVLILDEATSALDNASETIVQAAIDKLMASTEHTCIVIAHRLSTIRNADKIAFVSDGKVLEEGTHEELITKRHGRYKRLFDTSKRDTKMTLDKLKNSQKTDSKNKDGTEEEEEEIDWEAKFEEEETKAFNEKRARAFAAPETSYLLAGSVGAVMSGSIFPLWGILFSETISLLFIPVYACPDSSGGIPEGFPTCEDYWDDIADGMRDDSFIVAVYWGIMFFGCIAGFILNFWGFGMASERLSKRIRDSAFTSLLRQEVAFFDKRSVGTITSQLQDDAGRIQAFSGEPIRSFIVAMSSVLIGVTLSFIYMWEFALLAIGCVPLMGFATSMEMKRMLGEDEGDLNAADGKNSPGGIIVETLLNMRTVSALTLEKQRFKDYETALLNSEPNIVMESFTGGVLGGLSMFIQQWINALQLWFGGYLIYNNPDKYGFKDFLIANFAVLFALFGLGSAFQDISDRKEVVKSAGRIFYLLDRKSEIDPLSPDGKILDGTTPKKMPPSPPPTMGTSNTEKPAVSGNTGNNGTTTTATTAVPPSKDESVVGETLNLPHVTVGLPERTATDGVSLVAQPWDTVANLPREESGVEL